MCSKLRGLFRSPFAVLLIALLFVAAIIVVCIAVEPLDALPESGPMLDPDDEPQFSVKQIETFLVPVQSLINWSIALFAIVGYSLRKGFLKSNTRDTVKLLCTLCFIVSIAVSLYLAYKAQTAVVMQLNQEVIDVIVLSEFLERQAISFILAAAAAVAILFLSIFEVEGQ